MNKIKIYDKEYNCSNRVYLYIKGLESEKRLLKMEVSTKDKYINELQQRIDEAIEYINKYEYQRYCPNPYEKEKYIMREEKEGQELLDILRGNDNE